MTDTLGVLCPCGWRAQISGGDHAERADFLARQAEEHAAGCRWGDELLTTLGLKLAKSLGKTGLK